jgi:hypothetical protein
MTLKRNKAECTALLERDSKLESTKTLVKTDSIKKVKLSQHPHSYSQSSVTSLSSDASETLSTYWSSPNAPTPELSLTATLQGSPILDILDREGSFMSSINGSPDLKAMGGLSFQNDGVSHLLSQNEKKAPELLITVYPCSFPYLHQDQARQSGGD